MEKYQRILQYFNVYRDKDNCPQTTSYVEMDDIHNAILKTGVNMENPERHYIIKAKQEAINRQNEKSRRRMLLAQFYRKPQYTSDITINLDCYGFTEDEKELCREKLAATTVRDSKIARRQQEKLLESVKEKLLRHYKT